MHVLVVSETPSERARASSALAVLGDVTIDEATAAREAHRMVADADYDVLVIDGDLRPQGGFSLLYEIRAAAELAGTTSPPAVVLLGREGDRWLAGWSGANAVERKPVDPFELARRVREVVGEVPAERAPVDESADEVAAALRD